MIVGMTVFGVAMVVCDVIVTVFDVAMMVCDVA